MERVKAAALVDVPSKKQKSAKKVLTEEEKKQKGFSAGEKDLYREINQLKRA